MRSDAIINKASNDTGDADWQEFAKLVKEYTDSGSKAHAKFQTELKKESNLSRKIELIRNSVEESYSSAKEFGEKSIAILDPLQYEKAFGLGLMESPALLFDPAVLRLSGIDDQGIDKILKFWKDSLEREIELLKLEELSDEEMRGYMFEQSLRKLDRAAALFEMLPVASRKYMLGLMYPNDDTPNRLVSLHTERQRVVAMMQSEREKQEVNKAFARLFAAIESKEPNQEPSQR